MNTTLSVNSKNFVLAPEHILEAMFATISYRLEPEGRATRFPQVLTGLYGGYLKPENAAQALQELGIIEQEMKNLPPERAVWNLQDLTPIDPAGQPFNGMAKNAYDFFRAADNRPIIAVLRDAVYESRTSQQPLKLVAEAPPATGRAHLRVALTILAMLGGGLFLTINNWRTLINEGYYYPKASFIGPPLVLLGLFSIFRWNEIAEGFSGQVRRRKGEGGVKFSKVFWIIGIIIALACGGLNVYWLDNYFK